MKIGNLVIIGTMLSCVCTVQIVGAKSTATSASTHNLATKIDNGNFAEKKSLQNDTGIFNQVKLMYSEFVKLISNGVSDGEMTKFFNDYFDVSSITSRLTGSKTESAELTQMLIKYFKFLLTGQIIQQVKDYKLSDNFSQIAKKQSTIILCKLENQNSKNTLDMSVTLLQKTSKIVELAFMKSIYLIKGAKNIVDLYCQEKGINLKGQKVPERIKICITALEAYIVQHSTSTKK